MQINNIQTAYRPSFTASNAIPGGGSSKSSFWKPVSKQYDKATDWIAENYYEKFYRSKFAEKFINKCGGMKKMTTHMSAIGATLISGMYIIRTLENDKLDEKKRKTLALNDVLVCGLSTAGSYFLDSKLGKWCDKMTTRFAANYIDKNPRLKHVNTFGDWNPANINHFMDKWYVAKNRKIDLLNRRIEQGLADGTYKGARKPNFKHVSPELAVPYKNIRDFNLDVLKNKRLTTMIDGIGVLKSLFVFGMVYRYVVPVLVMKPANKIGAYIHKQNEQKEQAKRA